MYAAIVHIVFLVKHRGHTYVAEYYHGYTDTMHVVRVRIYFFKRNGVTFLNVTELLFSQVIAK